METNEFRLGNFILTSTSYDKMPQQYKSVFTIVGIRKGAIEVKREGTITRVGSPDPIPLTEEWLKRFGFDCFQDGWYGLERSPLSFNWNIYDKEFRGLGYCFKHIKYVHQLQNIIHAITGEELTLTNTET